MGDIEKKKETEKEWGVKRKIQKGRQKGISEAEKKKETRVYRKVERYRGRGGREKG